MSFKTIRPQIKTLLDSLTSGGQAIFQEVANTPKFEFSGYPAAHVVPSDNASEYETTIENERIYAFSLRCFYETKSTGVGTALDRLEDVVDAVIDALDEEDQKGSATRIIGVNLPTNYTFLRIEATPSAWGELPNEQLLMAEINIKVHISFDAS